jgi:hypothetical protein
MEADLNRLVEVVGEPVLDVEGYRIGKVAQLAYEPTTLSPEWLVVKTSRLGRPRLVPVASAAERGGMVHVPFSKETVLAAPMPALPGTPALTECASLQQHYRAAA